MPLLTEPAIGVAISFDDAKARDLLPLLRRKFGLADDGGGYSEALVQGIADLQERFGLVADGKLGPTSRRILEEELSLDAAPLWPAASASPEHRHAHYRSLCQAFEHELSKEIPTLLAIRGVRLLGLRDHVVRSRKEYDDTMVLLMPQGTAEEFRGATHPYQAKSKLSADLDLDGEKDVAMIRPGLYSLVAMKHLHKGHVALQLLRTDGSGNIPCYRDVDHDGWFSPGEMALAEHATTGEQVAAGVGAFADEILLHPGDAGFFSIGCQTAPSEKVKQLHALGKLDYLLVLATDAILRS